MRVRLRLLIFLLFIQLSSIGQNTFQKTYNIGGSSSAGYTVCTTDNNGFVVAGQASLSTYALFILRLDSNGDTLWCRTYDAMGYEGAIRIVHTLDGGYAIVGNTNSFPVGGNNIFLLKTDSLGSVEWLKKYQTGIKPNNAHDLIQKSDSGFAISGWFDTSVSGGAYFIETDKSGNLWSAWKYHGNNYRFTSLYETRDNGLIFSGEAGGANLMVTKRNSNGITWEKRYTALPNSIDGFMSGIVQTSGGDYIIGFTYFNYGSTYQSDFCLMKIDSLGNPLWVQTYGDTINSEAISYISKTLDGGYIAVGPRNVLGSPHNLFAIKVDSVGSLIWSKVYGGQFDEYAYEVHQTSDNGFCISGGTSSFDTSITNEVYFIKTDQFGNSGCNEFSPYVISSPQIVQTLVLQPLDTPITTIAYSEIFSVSSGLLVTTQCFDNNIFQFEFNETMSLYPNPASAYFMIINGSGSEIKLFNFLGELIVIRKVYNDNETINISNLPPGVYFVQIQNSNGTFVQKLIKQ